MDILSSVGASCARDIAEKTLTYVNENQNQNRKLNRPGYKGKAIQLSHNFDFWHKSLYGKKTDNVIILFTNSMITDNHSY